MRRAIRAFHPPIPAAPEVRAAAEGGTATGGAPDGRLPTRRHNAGGSATGGAATGGSAAGGAGGVAIHRRAERWYATSGASGMQSTGGAATAGALGAGGDSWWRQRDERRRGKRRRRDAGTGASIRLRMRLSRGGKARGLARCSGVHARSGRARAKPAASLQSACSSNPPYALKPQRGSGRPTTHARPETM